MNQGKGQEGAEHLGVEELFLAHAPFIASFVRRLGMPASEVDDVVQDIFLIAHKKGGYVLGPAKPRSWLASIAVHVVQNKRRSLARRREDGSELALELAESSGKTPAEQRLFFTSSRTSRVRLSPSC
jgi:RNA polymerase sigma-70 factor (ECF subfamily)